MDLWIAVLLLLISGFCSLVQEDAWLPCVTGPSFVVLHDHTAGPLLQFLHHIKKGGPGEEEDGRQDTVRVVHYNGCFM